MPTVSELTDLDVQFVSLVDRAAVRDPVNQSEPMRFLLQKAEEQGLVIWKRETPDPQEDSMTPEEQKAALTKAQDDLKAATERADAAEAKVTKQDEQIEALTKSVDEIKKAAGITDEPVPVDKSDWPESARQAFEKAEEDRKALDARVAKAEETAAEEAKLAKAERETRLTREFVTKAEKFKALSQKPAEFGPVLKSASEKLTKEEYTELERVLTAADNALETAGVFGEHGRSGDGNTSDTAIAEATQKAAEIRKADSKVTEAGALQQVFKADPKLAARYQDEVRGH